MSLKAGVGFSSSINPNKAAKEAVEQALEESGIETPDLVIVFTTVGYEQQLILDAVRKVTGDSPLIGCSGEGIIVNGFVKESNFNIAVGVLKSDKIDFRLFSSRGLKEDPRKTGRVLGKQLKNHLNDHSKALLCFADGLDFNYDSLYSGIEAGLGKVLPVPFLGGTSSDDWKFKATYQYINGAVLQNSAVCLLLSGDFRIVHCIKHGCTPVGDEHVVTKAINNCIYEIDGKPATDVINNYLAIDEKEDWQKTSVYLSIGIKAPGYMNDYDDFLIRYMPIRNLDEKSLYIPTEIPEGTTFFFTRRDNEKIEKGNMKLADKILAETGEGNSRFILNVECIGRGRVIFNEQRKQELLLKLQKKLNPEDTIPWLGLYTYGEFSPVNGRNSFHNYSNIIISLIE